MRSNGLRILLTTDAIGGVWRYAVDLARELAAAGHEPVLALLGPAASPAQRDEAEAASVRLIETGLPLDWLCDAPDAVHAAGASLAALASEMRVDIVQLNMPTLAAGSPFPMPVVAVAHGCVATWWEAAKRGEPLGADYLWHRALMADGLAAADAIVAPSAAYAEVVAQLYRLPARPAVVHNGSRPVALRHPTPPHDRVLTVGRLWDAAKRVDLLDRAAARLSVPFDAVGAVRGPHGEQPHFANLNLLGHVDPAALDARLATRPVFVSAASFEPFGLAVLEAAAAGCALVLSDIPTFRELWDGVALFIAGEDPADYSDAIETLIGDGALRHRLGDAARERAGRFTPQATTAAMIAIYEQLTRAGRERVAA